MISLHCSTTDKLWMCLSRVAAYFDLVFVLIFVGVECMLVMELFALVPDNTNYLTIYSLQFMFITLFFAMFFILGFSICLLLGTKMSTKPETALDCASAWLTFNVMLFIYCVFPAVVLAKLPANYLTATLIVLTAVFAITRVIFISFVFRFYKVMKLSIIASRTSEPNALEAVAVDKQFERCGAQPTIHI